MVVLAEEDHGAAVDGREVEVFVEVALAGGTLAEADIAERPLPFPLERQSDAGRLGDLRTDGAGTDDDAAPAAAEIPWCLAAAARGVGGAGGGGEAQPPPGG